MSRGRRSTRSASVPNASLSAFDRAKLVSYDKALKKVGEECTVHVCVRVCVRVCVSVRVRVSVRVFAVAFLIFMKGLCEASF